MVILPVAGTGNLRPETRCKRSNLDETTHNFVNQNPKGKTMYTILETIEPGIIAETRNSFSARLLLSLIHI